MMATNAIAFRSIDRPHLTLTEGDVSLCDSCGEQGAAEYVSLTEEFPTRPEAEP